MAAMVLKPQAISHRAIDALGGDWCSTGFARVRAVWPVLADSSHDAHLDGRIAGLAAVSRTSLPG